MMIIPVLRVLLLLIAMVLPGLPAAVLFTASDPGSWFMQAFLAASSGLVLVGVWGIVLAALGCFEPVWLGLGILLMSAALAFPARRAGWHWRMHRLGAWDQLALVLLVLIAVVFAGPHDNTVIGRDAGAYTNTAVHLARTGQWVIEDTFFAELPASTQQAFLTYHSDSSPFRLPGFFWIAGQGQSLSQFLPFYTVWMAILEWLFGSGGGAWAALLFAMVGAVGLASLAGSLWRPSAAASVLLLLLSNPAALWYARSANAEVALQVMILLFVALWMHRPRSPRNCFAPLLMVIVPVAAILDKVDVFYLIPVLFVALGLDWLRYPRAILYRRIMLLSLIIAPLLALYLWRFHLPYLRLAFVALVLQNRLFVLLGLGMISLLLAAAAIFTMRDLRRRLLSQCRSWVDGFQGLKPSQTAMVALTLTAMFILFFVVMPLSLPAHQAADKRLTLMKMGWYVTPVGFALAGLGALALLLERPREPAPLLMAFCAVTLLVNAANYTTDHIFAARRFVVLAVPGLLLFSAGGLEALLRWRPRRWPALGHVLALGLGLTMWMGQALNARALVLHREFSGARQTIEDIARQMPSGSVVLFAEHDSLLGTFAGPYLWLAHDLEPLYAVRTLNTADWRSVYDSAAALSRPLFYVGLGLPEALDGVDRIAIKRYDWHLPALEQSLDHFPRQVVSFDLSFTVWALVPGSGDMRYEPGSLLTRVGSVQRDALGLVLKGEGQPGYLSYGPYHKFPPGCYVARFWLANEDSVDREVRIDVTPFGQPALAEVSFTLRPLSALQEVAVPFDIRGDPAGATSVEMRVFLPDGGMIGLAGIGVLPCAPASSLSLDNTRDTVFGLKSPHLGGI